MLVGHKMHLCQCHPIWLWLEVGEDSGDTDLELKIELTMLSGRHLVGDTYCVALCVPCPRAYLYFLRREQAINSRMVIIRIPCRFETHP